MKRAFIALTSSTLLLTVLTLTAWGGGKPGGVDGGSYYVQGPAYGYGYGGGAEVSGMELFSLLLGVIGTVMSLAALSEAKSAQRQNQELRTLVENLARKTPAA